MLLGEPLASGWFLVAAALGRVPGPPGPSEAHIGCLSDPSEGPGVFGLPPLRARAPLHLHGSWVPSPPDPPGCLLALSLGPHRPLSTPTTGLPGESTPNSCLELPPRPCQPGDYTTETTVIAFLELCPGGIVVGGEQQFLSLLPELP